MQPQHLILIGFMGTGKSTVGRILADRLGRPWTDTDTEVERKTGKTIPELFRERGEIFFREWEKRILEERLQKESGVITTGGGIVLDPTNVKRMKEAGWVVTLDASEEELIRRLDHDPSRPLLAGDLRERVRKLKRERAGAYDFADLYLDTTDLAPLEVTERILEKWKEVTGSAGV
ncbi:shikimate kinase [Melghirimyces profundicolus]|uniref:Shikimate kinase n=1 Tax=Melghirimyces profundicolus TaxID=1242148 RepID=A0A2T6C9M4_9BACL|nr:shikimate kinase [Melghirimyces profundicolus]PTX65029.1 shikimate kinase [Melghirimyces profundicolus]